MSRARNQESEAVVSFERVTIEYMHEEHEHMSM
jgi:hypothetical protein